MLLSHMAQRLLRHRKLKRQYTPKILSYLLRIQRFRPYNLGNAQIDHYSH